jgi:hypothetical protein
MRSNGWLFNSLVALAASVMLCAGSPALPQSYPSQPIRIARHEPIAVVLDLMHPVRAARRRPAGERQAGFDEAGRNRAGTWDPTCPAHNPPPRDVTPSF